MSEWRTIETAPKDGTHIDLWVRNEDGVQWREADAYYVRDRSWDTAEWRDGKWKTVFDKRRDGWYAPNHDYEGADGFCDQPRYFNPHPTQNKWVFIEPTHWMPLPEPPEGALQ